MASVSLSLSQDSVLPSSARSSQRSDAQFDSAWSETCELFLASIEPALREQIAPCLRDSHMAGPGLRNWLAAITWRGSKLPEHVPAEVLQVYMNDPEAAPLHDCEDCGIAIPVRPSRVPGWEDEPEQIYFRACPVCGGRTGLFLYFSRQCETVTAVGSDLRRSKPR